MSNAPRIVLRPNPGVTTEQACNARAHAWAYAFSCFNSRSEQEAATSSVSRPDDARKDVQDAGTYSNIT